MNLSQRIHLAVGIGLLLPGLGCASIVSGQHAKVSFNSNVPNSHVVIRDKSGEQVAVASTPAVVELKRNDKYFMPAKYTATVEAPGYQPAQMDIRSTLNPWIFGNIVFGGVIGLVVDNASGAAWKPSQDKLAFVLQPMGYANQPAPTAVAQAPARPSVPAAAPATPGVSYPGVQTAMNATPATTTSPFGPPSLPVSETTTPLPAGQATAYQAQAWPPAAPAR